MRKNQIEPKGDSLLLQLLSPRDEFEQGDLLPPMTILGAELAFLPRRRFPSFNSEDDASSCGRRSSVFSSASACDSVFEEDIDEFCSQSSEDNKSGVLGLTLMRRKRKDGLLVKSVRAGGPAAVEGSIEEGDVIWSIDGVSFRCKSDTAHSLADLMRGAHGSVAVLEVRKSGGSRVVKTVQLLRQRRSDLDSLSLRTGSASLDPVHRARRSSGTYSGVEGAERDHVVASKEGAYRRLRSAPTTPQASRQQPKGAKARLPPLNLSLHPRVISGGPRARAGGSQELSHDSAPIASPGPCAIAPAEAMDGRSPRRAAEEAVQGAGSRRALLFPPSSLPHPPTLPLSLALHLAAESSSVALGDDREGEIEGIALESGRRRRRGVAADGGGGGSSDEEGSGDVGGDLRGLQVW